MTQRAGKISAVLKSFSTQGHTAIIESMNARMVCRFLLFRSSTSCSSAVVPCGPAAPFLALLTFVLMQHAVTGKKPCDGCRVVISGNFTGAFIETAKVQASIRECSSFPFDKCQLILARVPTVLFRS